MINFTNIMDRRDFAEALDVPLNKLTYVLYVKKVDFYYQKFEIPKKSGGMRLIKAPKDDLKDIQKKLAIVLCEHHQEYCRQNNIVSNISHAFEKKKSIITNSEIHRNKSFVLNVDLKNFFDSFHFGRVRGFFEKNREFNCNIKIATLIAQLACYEGCLPQGSPCSPIITNLICNILDMRLMKLAKKYHLDFTRYADDLTFSTNDKKFPEHYEIFYRNLNKIIKKQGFEINEKKTRLLYRDSRQEVTGLIVNKKINVDRRYYKKTRAMADSLYSKGEFEIDGESGTLNQLEGRFSFINQLDKYNNQLEQLGYKYPSKFNAREREYHKFLFYKYFWRNPKPLIATEGKTDVLYIKAALKKYYQKYPNLIELKEGQYKFKICFLNRTNRMRFFFHMGKDGADTMKNIYNCYRGINNFPDLGGYFKNDKKCNPTHPVILIFDNEQKTDRPLKKFLNYTKSNKNFSSGFNLVENMYVITNPLVDDLEECEIEDLFKKETLSIELGGKTFSREKDMDESKHFGKAIFADYVFAHYKEIDFERFIPLLDDINKIVTLYKSSTLTGGVVNNS